VKLQLLHIQSLLPSRKFVGEVSCGFAGGFAGREGLHRNIKDAIGDR
jgi:hypothetical protein